MTQSHSEVLVRDLGSTNGIRINGQRVETGWLRNGDELSIAHIRFRLQTEANINEATLAGNLPGKSVPREEPEMRNGHSLAPSPAMARSGNHLSALKARPMDPSFKEAEFPVQMREDEPSPFPTGAEIPAEVDNPLAAAVRNLLPAGMEKCRIQVIVQMPSPPEPVPVPAPAPPSSFQAPADDIEVAK